MKKVKKSQQKESISLLKLEKKGKIKKSKPENTKKLKEAVRKTGDLNLALEKDISTAKPKKVIKNKPDKKVGVNAVPKVSNDNSKSNNRDKQIKREKIKDKSIRPRVHAPLKNLTEFDLKKIEKKKSKKLAQKIRKLEKKAQNKNGDEKTNKDVSLNKIVNAVSSKVLIKKQLKIDKRKSIKEQKLAEKRPRDPALEAATVFVGNLPVSTKRIQLVQLFKKFGPVNSVRLRTAAGNVLYKHKQRKSAGSLNAYVVLKSKDKAERALSLNGVEFKGNHLRVTSATKNPQSNENEDIKRTVFVGNLKYSATDESLREIFSTCGEIDYVRCIHDCDKGCKGVAYVCFKKADSVGLALELNQTLLDERPINVERFSIKKTGAKEARNVQAVKDKKSKSGAEQRIEAQKGKKEKPGYKKNNLGDVNGATKTAKKSEFRGIKAEGLKRQKSKKKKPNNKMLKLAKKIAPRQ